MREFLGNWVMLLIRWKIGFRIFWMFVDNIITRIESEARSMNSSSERDTVSVMASSEHGEQIGITAFFEDVSYRNITFHELNFTDETRRYNPAEVGEFPVPRPQIVWQAHTHRISICRKTCRLPQKTSCAERFTFGRRREFCSCHFYSIAKIMARSWESVH